MGSTMADAAADVWVLTAVVAFYQRIEIATGTSIISFCFASFVRDYIIKHPSNKTLLLPFAHQFISIYVCFLIIKY